MKEYSRSERIGVQLQRELAQLIRDSIKDPRIGMVTVQAVKVNRELSHAKVYVTGLNLDGQEDLAYVDVLNNAAGFLRRELGKILKLRIIPELKFVYDESILNGEHLENLINKAVNPEK